MEQVFENYEPGTGNVKSSLTVRTSPKDGNKAQVEVNHRGTVARFALTLDEIPTLISELQGFLDRREGNACGPEGCGVDANLVEQARSAISALQEFVDSADEDA